MRTRPIKTGYDSWTGSGSPSLNHNRATKLSVKAGSPTAYGWIEWGFELPKNAVVASATATVYAAGASSGSRVMSLQRSGKWDPDDITYTNQPGVVGSAATASIGTLADADPITFTVTSQVNTIAGGAANYGFRLSTDATTAHKVYGFNSDHPPVLTIVYYIPPTKPTGIKPAVASVATNKWTLSWPYIDPDDTDLDAVQVQIDPGNIFSSPAFDSGWVTSADPELDLTTTAYAGLANLATTYQRVRVRDQDGGESAWSASVSIKRTDQGTLAITTPSGSTIKDPTPTVSWSLTGATQAFWRVKVTRDDDHSVVLHDTRKRKGTTTSYTIPAGVIDDEGIPYRIVVHTWDNVARIAVPNFPTYVAAVKTVTLADGAAGSPSSTTAVQWGSTPAVDVGWQQLDALGPNDTFAIVRDNFVIVALLDPADVLVSGTTYSYRDWTASPLRQHSYQVRRVEPGNQSPKSAAATVTPKVEGVWLVDTIASPARYIVCTGTDVDNWTRTDQYALHRVLGASAPVKITTALGGTDGTYKGALFDQTGLSTKTMLDRIDRMIEKPDRTFRLVAGQVNIPVAVADLSPSIHQLLFTTLDKATVSWRFWQDGEFSFKARI